METSIKADEINWNKLQKSLGQHARRIGAEIKLPQVMAWMEEIAGLCGPCSRSRKMLHRIGTILVSQDIPTIVAPACPDYSHEGGKYTFLTVGSGVSLLTCRHIEFLEGLRKIMPMRALILMADHEVDNAELCAKVGKSREEFLRLIDDSIRATAREVDDLGFLVGRMTDHIPCLADSELSIGQWIGSNPAFDARITSETIDRADMYREINSSLSFERMRERTISTAAQYVAMGKFAADNRFLVCNHTTTNLSWYLQTEAALLHNPVSVY